MSEIGPIDVLNGIISDCWDAGCEGHDGKGDRAGMDKRRAEAIVQLRAREAARRLAVKACEEVSKHWMCLDSVERALAANAAAEAGREPNGMA